MSAPTRGVDRVLRRVARAVAEREIRMPGELRLAPLREAARRCLIAEFRPRAEALAAGLRKEDSAARDAYVRLAAQALEQMQAQVLCAAQRQGGVLGAVARFDHRWHAPELPELMDDPALDEGVRQRIVGRLDVFNDMLGSYGDFLDALEPLLPHSGPTRILELAAGHGGFAISLAREARRREIALQIVASDIQSAYLDIGAGSARREGLPVEFRVQDALRLQNLHDEEFDIVLCTQSLHHFPAGLVALMFDEAARIARRGVVFVDGNRGLLAGGAALLAGLRFRDRGFAHDGWVSSRRFYAAAELGLLGGLSPHVEALEARWWPPGHCLLRSRRQ